MTTAAVRSDDIADWPPRPDDVDAVLAGRHGIETTVYAVAQPLALRAREISPDASRVAAEGMVAAVADLVAVVGDPDPADYVTHTVGDPVAADFVADLDAPFWRRHIDADNVASGGWAVNLALVARWATHPVSSTVQADVPRRPTPPPAPELVAALERLKGAAAAIAHRIEDMETAR